MNRFCKLCATLLSFLLFCSACGDSAPTPSAPDEPNQLQTYTAVLVDRSSEPAATAYFSYAGDTTLSEILTALADKLHVSLDLQRAEVTASAANIAVGPASILCTAETEAKLRGILDSIYSTVRQNYGVDKAVFVTAAEGMTRFGIDLTGTAAYRPKAAAAPEPGEGELSADDAKLYAHKHGDRAGCSGQRGNHNRRGILLRRFGFQQCRPRQHHAPVCDFLRRSFSLSLQP